MSDVAITETPKPKRKYTRRKPVAAKVVPLKVPDEFAGLTEFDCCAACKDNRAESDAAQRRLNELERSYPKRASPNPRGTVLESDAEWLARCPDIAEEFWKLVKQQASKCVISGVSGCAHPFKGGLQPALATPDAVARYERAVKVLKHRKIDLTRGGM